MDFPRFKSESEALPLSSSLSLSSDDHQRTIPGLSIDTKLIYDLLSKCDPGDIVAYRTLSELISRDVQGAARSCLQSAMRRLVNDGVVFSCVRGVGIKRLSDSEIVGEGPATLAKIRRAVRRAGRKLQAVQDYDSLSHESQIAHNATISMFGALNHMSQPKTFKKLEGKIEETRASLPLAKTLELIGK